LTGVGTVALGKSTLSFDLEYKNDKGKMDSEHFSFKHSDIPDDLPDGFKMKNGKEYWFNIRADGSQINNIRPASGTFKVHASGVAKDQEGKEFSVIEKTGDYGAYCQFVVDLEVLEGSNTGITYPLYLPLSNTNKGTVQLKFGPDDEGNLSPMGNPEKSANIRRLFDFIICSGLVDVTMPWKDEYVDDVQLFLKAFDKAIRKLDVTFELKAKNGYPDYMGSIETEDEEVETEEEVEDEPVPAKKSTKKVVVEDDDEEDEDTDADDDEDEPVVPAKKRDFSKLKK
jgi:hypothetical protein